MIEALWPRAALFDLDGTLIDSVPDITLAIGDLLEEDGLPRPSEAAVRKMIGGGVPRLVEVAFAAAGRPQAPAELAGMIARMMDIYPRHLTGRTVLMPGAREALAFLAGRGARLAIVTNKPQAFVEIVLAHFGLLERFELILGDDPLAARPRLARKPAPDMLRFALAEFGIDRQAAIMVGDSEADIRSAQAAGVYAVAVRGGYAPTPLEALEPNLVLDSLADLPGAIMT